MQPVLIETLTKTFQIAVIVIPLLFLVEYFNHHYGDRLVTFFETRKKHMPLWAALLAMLPGCNAAVAIGLLYLKGFISMGALVTAMIATSDEAIYVFIPERFNFLPLFVAKFLLAIIAGYLVDFVTSKRKTKLTDDATEPEFCCHVHEHTHSTREMFIHSLRHSLKIVFFVFAALFTFNYLKDLYGFEALSRSFLVNNNFSPIFAGIIGLIPGCGTSVVLATLYTQGVLSFGAALAGLSVASGDVILVLLGSKMGFRKIARILIYVFLVSVLAGYIVRYASIINFQ